MFFVSEQVTDPIQRSETTETIRTQTFTTDSTSSLSTTVAQYSTTQSTTNAEPTGSIHGISNNHI